MTLNLRPVHEVVEGRGGFPGVGRTPLRRPKGVLEWGQKAPVGNRSGAATPWTSRNENAAPPNHPSASVSNVTRFAPKARPRPRDASTPDDDNRPGAVKAERIRNQRGLLGILIGRRR